MHQTFDAALEMNLLHANQAGADHNREHAVIEGDMTTELDADRLRQCGVPVVAINTG
jgi:hydrogenase nickel incorporation protein HypB